MTLPVAWNIPQELRDRKQWVAWNLEKIEGRPKPAKIPLTVDRRASTTEPKDWLSFDQAYQLASEMQYSGVGFVFTKDDEYVGVDLDNQITDGKLSADAEEIVNLLAPAYVEKSQSGAGIHVIVKGKLPPGARRKGPFESYSEGRYFAITGDILGEPVTAIGDHTVQLQVFHEKFLGGKPVSADPLPAAQGALSAEELTKLLASIAASPDGPAFHRLYVAGETRPGKSGSESDLNLACLFAKYARNSADIEALMEGSALKRPKWSERHGDLTYLQRTIKAALLQVHVSASDLTGPPQFRRLLEIARDPDAWDMVAPVLRGIAWKGRVTMLSAREKMGKSTLVAAGAAALTKGREFLGLLTPGPADVAWVSADREAKQDILARVYRFHGKLKRTWILYPSKPDDVHLALAGLPSPPKLVVVDTLWSLMAAGVEDPHGSAKWPQMFLPFLEYARATDAAVVILHHASKKGGYRDSTAIGGAVDMILEMTPVQGEISKRNIHPVGRFTVEDYSVDYKMNKYEWSAPARPKEERMAELSGAILGWLRQNPNSSGAAVEQSVTGQAALVRDALKALVLRGEVEQTKSGRGSVYTVRAAF